MPSGKAKIVGRKPTETVGTVHPGFPKGMVQGWDREKGLNQARSRTLTREEMGRKMTPKGPGTMKPAR